MDTVFLPATMLWALYRGQALRSKATGAVLGSRISGPITP